MNGSFFMATREKQPIKLNLDTVAPFAKETVVRSAVKRFGDLVVPPKGPGAYSLRNAAQRAENAATAHLYGKDLETRRRNNQAIHEKPHHPPVTTIFKRH